MHHFNMAGHEILNRRIGQKLTDGIFQSFLTDEFRINSM